MIITIDGYAGTGKSTVCKQLANLLGFAAFDTGAMYRAFTWFLVDKKIDLTSDAAIEKVLEHFPFYVRLSRDDQMHFFVGEREVTQEIRHPKITELVSPLSAKGYIRQKLLPLQRDFARGNHVIFEGRDMGTVVFPGADVKFFLTADPSIRAERRTKELQEKFPHKDFSQEKIQEEMEERDQRDASRKISPLQCPKDAFVVDTSHLSIEQVVDILFCHVKEKIAAQFPKMKLFYRSVLAFARFWLRTFYRYRVYGLEHFQPGGALLAANHVSFFDPIAISVGCPEEVEFVAKESLFSIPLFGTFISHLNAHPISGTASDKATFRQILDLLKQGKKVLAFPEGSRSETEEISALLPGIGLFSFLTRSAIVPVYVHGTYDVWNRFRKFPKFFGKIICVFGSPILPYAYSGMHKKEAITEVNERLYISLKELQAWVLAGCKGRPP